MRALTQLLNDLDEQMRRTAERVDVESVHRLRVSVRRATEGLRLYEDEVPHAKRLRAEIRKIRRRAGAVRDRDVTRELLRQHRLPASDPACIYLDAQRDLAAQQLQQYLRKRIQQKGFAVR